MLFSVLYFSLRSVLRLVPAVGKDERDKDIEILVLRHQLKVLSPQGRSPLLAR